MTTKLPYPEFASEAEEANWLNQNRDELDRYFSPMDVSVQEMLLRDYDLVLPDVVLSVPLSKEDMAKTNAIAASEGLDAEAYVGKMLHELLESKQAA
jgi:hypothetical protein